MKSDVKPDLGPSPTPALLRRRKTVEMGGVVDSSDVYLGASDVDLIDTARSLREPPIGGKRKIGQLNKQRPVYAIVGDEDDDLIGIPFMDEAKRVG